MPMKDVAPIAVTMGEPAGVGPELIMKSWCMRDQSGAFLDPFFVLGDPELFKVRAKDIDLEVEVRVCTPEEACEVFPVALPLVSFDYSVGTNPGTANPGDASVVISIIEKAVDLVKSGAASGMVTGPVSKWCLLAAGFKWLGHTSYLGHLAEKKYGSHLCDIFSFGRQEGFSSDLSGHGFTPVMLLLNQYLRSVPITTHVSVREVPDILTQDLIVSTSRIVARDFRRFFGIEHPRLAMLGLNPHAGENGLLGHEEELIIKPAISSLLSDGIEVTGPHSADTIFCKDKLSDYDVAMAMYHDQGIIPVKALSFHDTVNVTLGLPFVRTSPGHGTSFDIAGKGIARQDSFVKAIELAGKLARIQRREIG